jgi:hypothetical protein
MDYVYNIELSVNTIKETKFSEIEMTLKTMANYYNCDHFYSFTEEDGINKIPRYHSIYVIKFINTKFDNLINFIKYIKHTKSIYIECIYHTKLIYASALYLKTIDKESAKKYKLFITNNTFTPNEQKLIHLLV